MITTMGTAITTTITDGALSRLLAWCSPAYPVGGFSYSHGIEAAVEHGLCEKREGLVCYIETALRDGAGAVDGPILAACHRAAEAGDDPALDAAAELAAAFRGTAELSLESLQQGGSFASVTQSAWPDPRFAAFAARHKGRLAHAAAFGAAAGFQAVPLHAALFAFLSGFAANLVSAGVRLVPLGQTDGQLATAALLPAIQDAVAHALETPAEDAATASPMLDWLSMAHETQYTRLFRS
ncbi:urease accessory protein UreF [Sabulicella glaciei]|uniref:Urease accessory protein UreF n=1 Tax=Sabulicella glaciei TaxID=2984948 RepID=A0ABT3NWR1_9PROT|nr:urease accessory UreF family protein [Roseococcus sp. MDT2-1-1]MCW8086333.1 urease accessory protein UreF [Roseococcus sp. MDT2-1-1]